MEFDRRSLSTAMFVAASLITRCEVAFGPLASASSAHAQASFAFTRMMRLVLVRLGALSAIWCQGALGCEVALAPRVSASSARAQAYLLS